MHDAWMLWERSNKIFGLRLTHTDNTEEHSFLSYHDFLFKNNEQSNNMSTVCTPKIFGPTKKKVIE